MDMDPEFFPKDESLIIRKIFLVGIIKTEAIWEQYLKGWGFQITLLPLSLEDPLYDTYSVNLVISVFHLPRFSMAWTLTEESMLNTSLIA